MTYSDLTFNYEEQVLFQLRQLYQQYGYVSYHMSKFEEYELYARNKSFLVSEHILTFTDTDGRLLALKPDVTLSILKNKVDTSGALQKVFYNENVYRTAPTSHGYREIMQAGLECIGPLDSYAVAEVVELAARSLELIRPDYLLDLSHMGMVSGLLEAMGWEDQSEILTLVGEKNVPSIRSLCTAKEMDPDDIERLCALAELYGTPEQVLPLLEELAVNPVMTEALDQLKELCTLLAPYQEHLRLDFSIVNDMRYYNGIIFRGYLPDLATGVLSGGQYDNLLRRMGKPGQAIGFAVYMDQLERYDRRDEDYDADVLLLYHPNTKPETVAARAADLRREGKRVRVERTVPVGLRFRSCQEVE